MYNWFRQLLTGADNETVAIGRVLGLIVFVIFVMTIPPLAIIAIGKHWIGHAEWGLLFDKFTVYVPALILSVAGLIGLTAPSEPKK